MKFYIRLVTTPVNTVIMIVSHTVRPYIPPRIDYELS